MVGQGLSLPDLAENCVENIVLQLDSSDVMELDRTCRALNSMIRASEEIWKSIYARSFSKSRVPADATACSDGSECRIRRVLYDRLRVPQQAYFLLYEPILDTLEKLNAMLQTAPILSTSGCREDGYWLESSCVVVGTWFEAASIWYSCGVSPEPSCRFGEAHDKWFQRASSTLVDSVQRLDWVRAFSAWMEESIVQQGYDGMLLDSSPLSRPASTLENLCKYRSGLQFMFEHVTSSQPRTNLHPYSASPWTPTWFKEITKRTDSELSTAFSCESVDIVSCPKSRVPASHWWWTRI